MKEFNTKPDVKETGNKPGRTELPSKHFTPDPNKPCDNIRDIKPEGSYMYRVSDSNGKMVDTVNKMYGDYVGHTKSSILFGKVNERGGITYTVCDSKMKRLGQARSENIGKFAGMSGDNMKFEKDHYSNTYNKNFQKVGNPIRT